jgi:transposase
MHIHLPPVDELKRLLEDARARALSARAQERLGWLIHYRESGSSVSETCRHFGITRITFYRLLHRFDPADLQTLEDQTRRMAHSRSSSLPPHVLSIIRSYREKFPQLGKERIAELLATEHAMFVSSSAIGRAIAREGMYFGETPLHERRRSEREVQGSAPNQIETFEEIKPRSDLVPSAPAALAAASEGSCWHCRVQFNIWPRVKRAFVVACVVTNLAILALGALTALWETDLTIRADLRGDEHVPTHTESIQLE